MDRLAGKVALITGATAGIGRTTAILFAKEGAKVVVVGLSTERGEKTVRTIKEAGGEAIFVKADVSKAEDVKSMIKEAVDTYGKLDVLFNNAGIQGDVIRTADLSEENYDKVMAINLKGVWLGMKYAIPEMLKTGGGSIINSASTCGPMVALKGAPHYGASKAGIVGLSRITAIEYVTKNIRVNCINAGPIFTTISEDFKKAQPEDFNRMVAGLPMGRHGTTEDVAYAALFLASDESSYVTGTTLVVDGGLTASSLIHLLE